MADEPETKLNLVNLIKEKVIEQFKTVDVVTLIKNVIASTPEDEENDDVRTNLLQVLDQYNAMNDEDKEIFANKMKNTLAEKVSLKFTDGDGINLDGVQEAISQAIMYRFMIFIACVVIFFILLVFFGYKLYKSIKEKEIKREEKKKAKELKKKK